MPPKADVPRTLVNEKAMRLWLKKAGGDPGGQGSEGQANQPANSTTERRKKLRLDVHGDAQSKQNDTNEEPTAK
ncbi:Protein priB, partial [Sesbania bispinosa]